MMGRIIQAVRATAAAAFALLLATATAARADDVPLRDFLRQTWQTAEGLPQNSVRAIVQTPEGYLWLATAEGLVRFDGIRFTVFDRTSTPALPVNNVGSLTVASDGALWIGFRRHGAARFHRGQLTMWTTAQGLSGNEIESLAATADGSVWVGTVRQGLNRIRDGQVTVYRREQGLPDNDCQALSPSASTRGGVIVGTGSGAALVSDAGIERLADDDPRVQGVVSAVLDGDVTTATATGATAAASRASDNPHAHDLWLGTPTGLLHVQAGQTTRYTTAEGLPSNDITALARGNDRTLWIGMRSGGLARFRDGRFDTFTARDGLPDDFIHTVYEDAERNVWVGTNIGGISRLRHTPFRTVSKRDGLPVDVVRAVFESRDGSMWVGTHAYGLTRILNGQVTHWTTETGLPNDGVSMISQSRDGAMWIGTRDGLVRIDGARVESGTVTRYTTATGLPHNNVRSWFEDRDGHVWIGSVGGVCQIEGTRCVPVAGLNVYARGFHQAADGTIWIATHRGLYRYEQGGRVTHWGQKEGLSSDFLTSLAAEADGTLWLSSDAGLNRFKDGRVTTYRAAQGLYDDTLFRVLADGRGHLWMTSNRGLFRVARAELDAIADGRARTAHAHAYTEVDGLPSPEFNGGSFPAGMVARDGRLWLPSVKGVVIVDPSRVETAPAAPIAHVERMVVDGRALDPTLPATVGPGDGNLEFQYTAFRFVSPTRLRFRYKLDGFDPDWIEAGTRRTAYYTRLPPGQYSFHVRASNEAGEWGTDSATVAIALTPRFYQTRWFVALSVLAAALLVVGAFRIRSARHLRQERRLQSIVDARTCELQAEVEVRTRAERALVEARESAIEGSRLKSEFLANMSHEIRTPMNGIIGMTELALEGQLEPRVREYLQIVQSSADGLLHVINDILDFAKIEAGRLDLVPVDFDLPKLIHGIVALLGPHARDKGLTLTCHVPSDVPPRLVGDPVRLRQILTNLVGNALKFTDHGEIRIEVTRPPLLSGESFSAGSFNAASSDGARHAGLRFAVIDTGVGIAEADRARIFEAFTQVDGSATRRFGGTGLGLAISSQLVALMGGRLEVDSTLGRGSTFSFVVAFGIAEAQPAVPARPTRARAARPLAVLVAEDGAVNQLLVRRLLENVGHTVTVVETGAAAIEALAQTQFDAVLMDVQMPVMNGFDATSRIRASETDGRRRVPIIALTAHAMQGDRERCLAAGMDGYVSKPIRPDALFASLAEVTAAPLAAAPVTSAPIAGAPVAGTATQSHATTA